MVLEKLITEKICEGTYTIPSTLGWIVLIGLVILIIIISYKLRPIGSTPF